MHTFNTSTYFTHQVCNFDDFFLEYITLAVKLDDRFVQNFVRRKEAT